MNNNQATATGNGKTAYGGAIYNSGTLTMSAGTIGTTTSTKNTATSAGGAIYQDGILRVKSSINFYNTSNTATENDVYLPAEKTVEIDGSFTNPNTVMKLTPAVYALGTFVVEKTGSINETNFKNSLAKIKLIPNGICSGVAYSSNNYSAGATAWTGMRGVVGIDFSTITEDQIKSYTYNDNIQSDFAGGVHYCLIKNTAGKYGVIEFNVARSNATTGNITAKYVVFNPSRATGELQNLSYSSGSYIMGQTLVTWSPFNSTGTVALMWDGSSINIWINKSTNSVSGYWLY